MAGFISDILIPALGIGSIYALIGISFNLIFAPGGTFNFAQGQIVMLGGLLAFTLSNEQGWPFHIGMLLLAIAITYGLHVFFRRSKIGRAITAVAQDRDAAALRGVNVRQVISLGFIMGGALAAVTGMLAAPFTLATVTVGLI